MSHGSSSSADEAFVPDRAAERQRLARLRENWGKPIERLRDPATVTLFHGWTDRGGDAIDEQTWADLGLDELFALIDRTAAMPGRQVLYHQMRTYADAATLAERARQHAVFRHDRVHRERVQLVLTELDRPGAAYIAPLVLGQLPPRPAAARMYFLLSILTPICLAGIFFFPPLLLVSIALILVNAVIYATYGQQIMPYFSGFAQIDALLTTAEKLGRLDDPHALPALATLKKNAPLVSRLRRRLGPLVTDRNALPDPVQSLLGYLNMLFLFDVVIFLRSLRLLQESQRTLADVFEAVGSLDAAIAVASYLDGLASDVTVPELVDDRRVEVTALYHPLIPDAVANSLDLADRGALIAGPNMAGKTAFIRTLGVNVVLAQTLHFCLARQARLPRARVRSAIRREDRLSDGRSYFFAEINQILEFARTEADAPRHLFLIDEIFRGTNTTERIACSAAVLRHLARHHLVFATTHDAELQEMLADICVRFHFADRVTDGNYSFDYLLRPGPAQSRNAIRLLEISGYPQSITREAEQLAAQLETRRRTTLRTPAPASPPPASDTPSTPG